MNVFGILLPTMSSSGPAATARLHTRKSFVDWMLQEQTSPDDSSYMLQASRTP